jgi:acyl carrier protein
MTPEAIVAQVFGLNEHEIDDSTSNKNLEAWDSMGHVTLIMELEAVFGVALSMEDALEMTSVADIKRILAERGVAA